MRGYIPEFEKLPKIGNSSARHSSLGHKTAIKNRIDIKQASLLNASNLKSLPDITRVDAGQGKLLPELN